MHRLPNVALIIDTALHDGRELIRGIGRYLQAHDPWSVSQGGDAEHGLEPAWLRDWDGDGIITCSENPTNSYQALERGIPVVNLAYWAHLPKKLRMPSINCDQHQIGRLGAEHFLRRGFKNLAYCHLQGLRWSEIRRDSFTKRLAEEDLKPNIYNIARVWEHPVEAEETGEEQLCEWIRSLPKPCAVMAACDRLGVRLVEACRREGVRVPEEIAMIGVDNDPLSCWLTSPPLSSVDQNVEMIGFQAARLLARLMKGEEFIEQEWPILTPPRGITTRTSSDIIAFDDSQVAAALHFIRNQSRAPIAVEEVWAHVNLSRRDLERRFRKVLSTTPNQEIQRARIKRVIDMLLHTDNTLEAISDSLQFSEAANMAALFKKVIGTSPGDYRRTHKAVPGP